MAKGLGMRGKDVRDFCKVARQYQVYILVRHTNEASLGYIGSAGYYPKPATIKAKTADVDPPAFTFNSGGAARTVQHRVAGLVPHPGFQPKVFAGAKMNKAMDCWADTLDVLYGAGVNIPATTPDTWPGWGKEHTSARSGWRWRVDVDPLSPHFGCLQIARDGMPMSYLHGDYDLKDVIVKGMETYNQRLEGKVQGAKNYTPLLPGLEFETIRKALNEAMGIDMVQHGAEAQFAWHGDEPITVILPDGPQLQFQVLGNAEAVQRWYIERNREVIAKKGKDYIGDKTRWFWFGNHGNLFRPGMDRSG
ncbi:MAG: hypothetical protein IPL57_23430 [Rubrivivax sp.]|nr:hypothetical protein [Rubrivivax sp.]